MKCPNEIQERRERERGAQNKISAKKRKMGRREETKIKEVVVQKEVQQKLKKRFNEN